MPPILGTATAAYATWHRETGRYDYYLAGGLAGN